MKPSYSTSIVLLMFALGGCGGGPECGDALLGGRETCDDGNTAAGDGCSPVCAVERGYECPDGATCDPVCQDGIVVEGEVCDPSDGAYTQYCSADCTQRIASCGDGTVQTAHEKCDDQNATLGDGCAACAPEFGFFCIAQANSCDASTANRTTTLGALAGQELSAFCIWLVDTLGGGGTRHVCGDVAWTVSTVGECVKMLGSYSGPEAACTVADYETYVAKSGSTCGYFSDPSPICKH